MRTLVVLFLSFCLTATVIGYAFYQKKQFYPAVVYITKLNPSMAVIYIQAFILVLLFAKLMRKVFFGQLRAAEFEHLMERSWYAITETCLAFTVFRDDFTPKFIALFTVLLFLKSFHWLAEDRVDYMERSPVISWLFHIRILSLLFVLSNLDSYFLIHAYQATVTKGASVQLVFGFEYAILLVMFVNILCKYILHSTDARRDTPWEGKAVVLLCIELAVSGLKVAIYVSFVMVMVRTYTLPLFAFRPMYYAMRDFKKAYNDLVLSQRAIANMNTLYPDATPEELAAADNVCIICREEMHASAKKLPCNHIFHSACLRSWFQRQQTCPTCRLNILRPHRPRVPAQAQRAAAAAPPAPGAAPPPLNIPMPHMPHMPHLPMPNVPPPNMPTPNVPMPNTPMPNIFPGMPFPMPPPHGMAGIPPPPPMPPNLETFTPAELARMEGTERRHVEARIRCLQNMRQMLDASVIMMQQYSAIMSRLPPPRDVGTQTTERDTTT